MTINPSEHISEKLDNDAEAREEFNAALDAEDLSCEVQDDIELDDDFDLTDEWDYDMEWEEADADAWHSQWD